RCFELNRAWAHLLSKGCRLLAVSCRLEENKLERRGDRIEITTPFAEPQGVPPGGRELMKRIVAVIAVVVAFVVGARGATAGNVADFIDFSLRNASNQVILPGRLYVPPEATSDPTTPRPFILFMHGGGEDGTDNVNQVNVNIDNLLAEAKRRGA